MRRAEKAKSGIPDARANSDQATSRANRDVRVVARGTDAAAQGQR